MVLAVCMCVVIGVSFFSDYSYQAQLTCVRILSVEECEHVSCAFACLWNVN